MGNLKKVQEFYLKFLKSIKITLEKIYFKTATTYINLRGLYENLGDLQKQ